MKLFTKEINDKLYKQYPKGGDLENQVVVAKIFNPYGNGRWFLLNSDPQDPDYLWAIVEMGKGNVEIGSVSRRELESIRVTAWRFPLERDLSFRPINAKMVYDGLLQGKHFEEGGEVENENKEMLENQATEIKHHSEELKNALKKTKEVQPWVVAKAERSATDLSDITHYLEGESKSEYARGGEISIKVGDKVKQRKKMGSVVYGVEGEVYEVDGSFFKLQDKFGNKSSKLHNIKDFKPSDIKSMAKGGRLDVGRYYRTKDGRQVRYLGDSSDPEFGTFMNKNQEVFKVRYDEITGKASLFEDGGVVNRDLNLFVSKKAQEYAKQLKPQYFKLLMGQAVVDALGDANFHSEAKRLVVKFEGKKEWSDDLYQSEYYDSDDDIHSFAVQVSQKAQWDGTEIADAFIFAMKMTGLHAMAKQVEEVMNEEYASGGMMAKGGGFNQYGEPYGFDYSPESPYEFHHKEGENKPYKVWDKIDGQYIAEFNSRQSAIEFIERKEMGFADGGMMANGGKVYVDLFENRDELPYRLKAVLDKYEDEYGEDISYQGLLDMQKDVEELGYTFDFGLDSSPYGLRPIGVEISQLEGYEGYGEDEMDSGGYMAKGGEIRYKLKGNNFGQQIESGQKFKVLISKVFENQSGDTKYPENFIKEIAYTGKIVKSEGSNYLKDYSYKGTLTKFKFLDDKDFLEALKYVDRPSIKSFKFEKGGYMASGGRVKFADKVEAVKKSLLERKKVPKVVQKDYGKTFSPAEAEDSAKRIVGAQTARERLMARMKSKKKK